MTIQQLREELEHYDPTDHVPIEVVTELVEVFVDYIPLTSVIDYLSDVVFALEQWQAVADIFGEGAGIGVECFLDSAYNWL